jgi:hypothetical protein
MPKQPVRLHSGRASFDKLRMRKIEDGIGMMPRRTDLILSLSKDAQAALQFRSCSLD